MASVSPRRYKADPSETTDEAYAACLSQSENSAIGLTTTESMHRTDRDSSTIDNARRTSTEEEDAGPSQDVTPARQHSEGGSGGVGSWIIEALYTPLLDEGRDDASQRFRKGVMTVSLIGLPAGLAVGFGNYFSDASSQDWTPAKGVAVLSPVLLLTLPSLYAITRSRRVVDEWQVQLFLVLVMAFFISMTISTLDVTWAVSWVQFAVLVLLSRTAFAGVWWLLSLLGLLLAIWNDTAAKSPEYHDLALHLPGIDEQRRFATQLIVAVPFSVFTFIYLLILNGQLNRSEELADQSAASARIARTIARMLNRYDIARANKVLLRQRELVNGRPTTASAAGQPDPHDGQTQSGPHCDPQLLEAFDTLVRNLATYRPHIPNWLIPSESEQDVLHEADKKAGALDASFAFGQTVISADGIDDPDLVGSISGATMSVESVTSPEARGTTEIPNPSRSPRVLGKPAITSPSAPCPRPATLIPGQTPVVAALVAFQIRDAPQVSVATATEIMDHVTDRIFTLANQTGAAVHSFLGDTVQVTWNAASRVVQHDVKAARFLARLREGPGHPDVDIGGAAFSGLAAVGSNGLGDGQRAVTLRARWWSVLQSLFDLGRRHGTIVVNHALKNQSEFALRVRGVGGITLPDWKYTYPAVVGGGSIAADVAPGLSEVPTLMGFMSPTSPASPPGAPPLPPAPPPMLRVGIYEVIAEVSADQDNDEWMYVLHRSASMTGESLTSPNATSKFSSMMNRIVEHWTQDRDSEVQSIVASLVKLASVAPNESQAVACPGFALAGLRALAGDGTAEDSASPGPAGGLTPLPRALKY